jgi:hypothetical protein
VHRHQLHRVGRGRRHDLHALALLLLGGEVGEQGHEGDVAVHRLEVGHRPDEQVEVVAPSGGRRTGR